MVIDIVNLFEKKKKKKKDFNRISNECECVVAIHKMNHAVTIHKIVNCEFKKQKKNKNKPMTKCLIHWQSIELTLCDKLRLKFAVPKKFNH